MTWGTEQWGIDPWGCIVFGPSASGEPIERVLSTDVYAHDLIEIVFNAPMKNNATLQDVASYVITDTDGAQLEVEQVLTSGDVAVRAVYLVVAPFVTGELYTVTVSTQTRLTNGSFLSALGNQVEFIGRKTKIDSLCSTRPRMYNLTPTSLLRNILNAIGREDDLIGGNRDDESIPLSVRTSE